MGQRLVIHFRNVRGVKTIIKNIKKFDKKLVVKDYGTFIVVESDNVSHYISCNSIERHQMCLHIFDSNDYSKELWIPLETIETIFR